jgi:tetratricopeptide (TPR) repeat protein
MVLMLTLAVPGTAAPRRPANDTEVLERLPLRPADPVTRELASLRQALRANPEDLATALQLANRYVELVGREGDPRYLGYAQAALKPWWMLADPPDAVRVLRAFLRQFGHDFDGAARDLDVVLQRDPGHAQARGLRATIFIVQARYAQARVDCSAMRDNGNALIATACEAMVDGLTGKGRAAYQALLAALAANQDASAADRLWVLLRLAEISARLGQTAQAEQHFRQALALGLDDTFLLAAYADLLLDLQRPHEVVALLKERYASDGLLLRLVLAERALGLPGAAARTATLSARYAAARLRSDTAHEQEEARFMLETGQAAQPALVLAVDNWRLQREPRDARVLLQAALATRTPAAAAPVLEWLDANRVEDVVLADLARRTRELPR